MSDDNKKDYKISNRFGKGDHDGKREGRGEERGERRSSDRGERGGRGGRDGGGYKKREGGGRDGDRKPFRGDRPRREDGEGRSFDRPRRDRDEGGRGERGGRDGGGYKKREGGSRDGDRKPFRGDRPRREDGEGRSFDRPRRDKDEGGERRSYNSDRPRREADGNREERPERRNFNSDRPRRNDREDRGERREKSGSFFDRERGGGNRAEGGDRERKPFFDHKKRGYDKNKDYSKYKGKERPENDRRRDKSEDATTAYFIMGKHPVVSALKNPARKVTKIVCTENSLNFLGENFTQEELKNYIIEIKSPDKIDSLLRSRGDAPHQGIVAEVEPLPPVEVESLYGSKLIIATDKITDPHNIGAILRSAAAFGASALITQEKNSPPENATIAKTSAGCVEIVPYVRVSSLWITLENFKEQGFQIVGLDGNTEKTIRDIDNSKPTILVIGSEGKGIGEAVTKICDDIVKIDISGVESLNASVAAAVAMYELGRKA